MPNNCWVEVCLNEAGLLDAALSKWLSVFHGKVNPVCRSLKASSAQFPVATCLPSCFCRSARVSQFPIGTHRSGCRRLLGSLGRDPHREVVAIGFAYLVELVLGAGDIAEPVVTLRLRCQSWVAGSLAARIFAIVRLSRQGLRGLVEFAFGRRRHRRAGRRETLRSCQSVKLPGPLATNCLRIVRPSR